MYVHFHLAPKLPAIFNQLTLFVFLFGIWAAAVASAVLDVAHTVAVVLFNWRCQRCDVCLIWKETNILYQYTNVRLRFIQNNNER